MKKIISILLALTLCLGMCPPIAKAVTLKPSVNNPTIDLKNGAVMFTVYEGQLCYVQDNKVRTMNMENYLPNVCDNQIFVDKVQLYTGTATITGTLSATAYGGIEVLNGSHKVKLQNASLCTKAISDTRGGFEGSALVVTQAASLTVELEGTNTVQGSAYLNIATNAYPGIDVSNGSSLTITGGGTLNVRAGLPTAERNRNGTTDILLGSGKGNSLTITGGATVNATIDNYTDSNMGTRIGIDIRSSGAKLTVSGGAKLHIAEKRGITASSKAGIEVENAEVDISCYSYGLGNVDLTLKGANSSYTITDYTSSLNYAKVEDSTVKFSPDSGSYSVLERGKTAASAKKELNPGTFSETVTTDKYIRFSVSNKKYNLAVTGGTGAGGYAPESSVSVKANVPSNQIVKEWQLVSGEGSFDDPQADPATFTMGWTDAAVKPVLDTRRTLTVSGGTASKTEGAQGHTVQLAANAAPEGKTFSKWTLSGQGEIKDPYNPNSSFTFGAENATVTAEFVQGSTLGDFLVVSDNLEDCRFDDTNNVLTISGSGTYSVSMAVAGKQTGHCIVITDNATVILNGVNISNGSKVPIEVGRITNKDNITLKLSGENTLNGGSGTSGIGALEVKTDFNNTTTLTITSLAGDGSTEGKLTATTNANSRAGIGTASNPATINILGGTIVATSTNGYGISATYKGTLNITGGDITAEGQNASSNVALYDPKISGEAAIELDKAGNYVDITQAKKTSKWAHVTFDTGSSSVTALTLEPASAAVVQGEQYPFLAQITAGPHATTDLTWEVTGGGSTIDENGLLTVGKDETAGTLTVTATNEYSGKKATATVTVERRPAEIITWPDTTNLTYGQTLSEEKLVGGEAEVAGTFAWADASYKPASAGTHYVDVIFTPSDGTIPATTILCEVVVKPATPEIRWLQESQRVEYTGSPVIVTPPKVTLVNGEVYDGEFRYSCAVQGSEEFTNGLPTGIGSYTVKASIAAQGNYTAAESTNKLALTITKADQPAPAAPSATDENIKDTSITLMVVENAEYSMDGGDWQDSPVFAGLRPNTEYNFNIRLKGDANHNESPSSTAAITTKKTMLDGADITVSGSYTYTGAAVVPAAENVKVVFNETPIASDQYTVSASGNINAGTATVTITATENGDYSGSASAAFAISPAPLTINANNQTITYGQSINREPEQATATGLCGSDTLSGIAFDTSSEDVPGGTITPSNAVIKNGSGQDVSGNYQIAYQTGTLTINKADISVTAPTAKILTYTGAAQELVTAGSANVGSVVYSLTETGEYSATIPTGTDTGAYTVWYKVDETANYNGTIPEKVDVKINKAAYTGTTAFHTSGRYGAESTYDLTGLLPAGYVLGEVSSTDENSIFSDDVKINDAKLIYTLANDAGKIGKAATITIPVTSSANYEPFSLEITVTVANRISAAITGVTAQNSTYDTTVHTGYIGTPSAEPFGGTFTVSYSGRNGTDYNSETPPVNAGDYTVTIAVPEDDETYIGNVTLDFSIAKAKAVIIADDKVAEVGDDAPEYTYTVRGLLESDTLITEPAFSCSSDMNTAGIYTITPTSADAGGNYTIDYENGTLFIKDKDVEIQAQIASRELSEVPEGLAGTEFNSVEAIKEELTQVMISDGYTEGNTAHHDVTLQISLDGGKTWIDATEDNFPAAGITIVLDYPEGTGKATHDFVVSHMFTATSAKLGTVAGEVETPDVEKTDTGLKVTLKGLSPVAVAWKAVSGGSGSGSGNGSYPPATRYYDVKVEDSEHGSVIASPTRTYSGGTVTLTATPDEGYRLEKISVFDSQNQAIEVTEENGEYTFKMPGRNVTVKAEFTAKQMATPTPGASENPAPTPGTSPSPSPWKNPFPDVSNSAWYIEAIEYVAVEGLMNGYANGKFGPNDNISRAEFAQIIYNMEGRPSAGNSVFTDVEAGNWYANAVTWAAEQQVVTGIGHNQFAPNRSITREELATMLWRYAGCPGAMKTALNFTDASEVSDFAKKAMLWANKNGIVNGKGNGLLDPKGKATRAETAQMLMNYLRK